MGTKPMVFPLDTHGHVYVLHNEADEPVCTGSRETCYRLLELMLEVKKHADEAELKILESTEQVARGADFIDNEGRAAKAAGAGSPML